MTGSLVVEKIFAIPGVGSLLVTAIQSNDYNVVISLESSSTAPCIIGIMLVVDLVVRHRPAHPLGKGGRLIWQKSDSPGRRSHG